MDHDDTARLVPVACVTEPVLLDIAESCTLLKVGCRKEGSCPVNASEKQYARWAIRAEFQVEQLGAAGKLDLAERAIGITTRSRCL